MVKRITIATPIQFQDELPNAADIVVIGAGVIGVFASLYLSRAGQSVVLLEKGRVSGEQSSRNWGWIRQQGRDPAELPIMMEALSLWHQANKETGGACGVRTGGVCYLANTDKEYEEYHSWISLAKQFDLDSRILSAKEVSTSFSGFAQHNCKGGLITPSDARAEPWRAVSSVTKLAQKNGVFVRENCAVRALDLTNGQVNGVITENGIIRTNQVIVAAGAWSSLFLRRHGINIPQLSVRGTVVTTTPMPQIFNGCICDDEIAMRRREDGGYTLANAESNFMALGPDALRNIRVFFPLLRQEWRGLTFSPAQPKGFPDGWRTKRNWSEDEISPFEYNRVLEPPPVNREILNIKRKFAQKFPSLGKPTISASWAGMIDTLPDVVPILGRAPLFEGLIVATGMSGHGFGIGPGFGAILARIATGKDARHDLSRFRFSRFTEGTNIEIGPLM